MRGAWRSTGTTAVVVVAGIVLGAAVAAAPVEAAPARAAATEVPPECSVSGETVTCAFNPGTTAWTVPRGIRPGAPLQIVARGQAGQNGFPAGEFVASGGRGAIVSASYVLPVGTPLIVRRAGAPGDGGGAGVKSGDDQLSGGGGGVSAVLVDLLGTDRTLVAAGGGGGGGEGALGDPETGLFTGGGTGGDAGLLGIPASSGAAGSSLSTTLYAGGGGAGAVPPPGERFGGGGSGGSVPALPPGSPLSPGCGIYGPVGSAGANGAYLRGGDAAAGSVVTPVAQVKGPNSSGGGAGAGFTGGGSGGGGATKECQLAFGLGSLYKRSGAGGGGGGSSYADPASATTPTSSLATGPVYADLGSVEISYPVDLTAPVPTIDDVTSPRDTPVGELGWDYHEPLLASVFPLISLTRDGVPVDVSGAVYFSSTSGRFGVDLDSRFTSRPGTYVFTVFADGLTDVAGNPVAGDVSRTWVNTLVANFSQPLTPRATAVDHVDIAFSAPVTGVDIGDFRLFQGGSPVAFQGASVSGTGANYTISGLAAQIRPQASAIAWEIELRGSGTGISAGSGNVPASTSVLFVIDPSTPPVATFAAVASTVVAGPDTIAVTFSEPVYAVDITDFRIFRDGSATPLTGATIRCTAVTPQGSCATFVLEGLAGLLSPEGAPVAWELELVASGSNITSEEAVALANNATVAFTVLATPHPTARFTAVTSPRTTGVDSLAITFSQSVYAVDVGDFVATRDGAPVSLAEAVLTPTGRLPDGSSATFALGGLSELTAPQPAATAWSFTLRSDGTDITDVEGQPLLTGTSTDFYVLAAAAPTAAFDPVATPRSNALGTAVLTFSEPVFGVDVGDLALTRGGSDVPLTGVTVSGSGAAYSVSGLEAATAPGAAAADYVLTLRATGTHITGDVGQSLAGGATLSFRVQPAPRGTVPTTTTLTRTGTPSWTTGLTLVARIGVPRGTPTPTGTVMFTVTPTSGPAVSCRGGTVVTLTGPVARCVIPAHVLRPGDSGYAVSAVFSGTATLIASDTVDTVVVPGSPSALTMTSPPTRRAGIDTSIAFAVSATLRPNGLVTGTGRLLVVDGRDRIVRCDRFSLMPGTPTFGCVIPKESARPGTYTVYAAYSHSPLDDRATYVGTVTLT